MVRKVLLGKSGELLFVEIGLRSDEGRVVGVALLHHRLVHRVGNAASSALAV
jgi:hypothetical protein